MHNIWLHPKTMWLIIGSGVWSILAMVVGWICAKIFHGLVNRWHVGMEAPRHDYLKSNAEADAGFKGEQLPLHKYDVFVNHRGPDVKATFAAALTDALCKAGFHPFLDAKSIGQGRHVFNSINEALSGACVHVAIFSKRYAESKYCLQELTDMVGSNHLILPVFYNVKPEDLRWIDKGPFAGGFRKHLKRRRHDKIKVWKEALRDISERRGFRKDEFDGDENQLIRSIVNAVHKEMPADLQPQTHLFGLEEPLKEVLGRIHEMKSDKVGILGLVGMGGIGKTTLATEIYNYFVSLRSFQYHCFLKDVRSSEPLELQRQLVQDLIQEEMNSSTKKYWFRTFEDRRALIIVDDIDNVKQFLNLIPGVQHLSPGSRVIVTSRHRDVLHSALTSTDHTNIYEVKVLNPSHSRLLFNWHAFLSETPSNGFHDLAEKVADACGGHPLALTLIGASLFDKKGYPEDRDIWMDAVKTLNENPDIQDQLRISYDSLPSTGDKAMFRDIACLLIGMREQVAMEIWNSCDLCSDYCSTSKGPHLVLRRLVDKSLVRVEAGKLSMRDVIRDMGRDIVTRASSHPWQEPPKHLGERTHLWEATTAAKVLTKNQGTDRIRGIKLSRNDNDGAPPYVAEQFAGMEELHLLVLDGCSVEGDDYGSWSPELRWLQWRSIPRAELPSPLHLPKLAVVDLTDSGNLTHLWHCQGGSGTVTVQFPKLQRLILTRCRALEELPANIGRSTPRLKTIEMESCSMIAVLPDSIGQLKDLEHLVLSGCKNLESLPDAITNLTSLKRFMLDGCSKLRKLPLELGRLLNLTVLQLSNCTVLHELPASITRLRLLKELDMQSACKLDGLLPPFLGALTALTTLHLCGNQMITVVPKSFGGLKSLSHLQMAECPALVSVEALPTQSLNHLDMANCAQLVELPSLADARLLAVLNLRDCSALADVQGLGCLTALEEINLAGCTSMPRTSGRYIMPSSALRLCYLSGSNVAVKYDTTWSKKEPALQILSYYGDGIGYFANGMTEKVVDRTWSYELIVETTIASTAKCVALIICCVGHDQGFSSYPEEHGQYSSHCGINVEIKRGSMVVIDTLVFSFRHADKKNQVYFCTLRRKHFLIESLQLGDKICVYARSRWAGWAITVLEGALCVVHGEDEAQQVIAVNSELLSRSQSEGLAAKLGELVLADHSHSSLMSALGCGESSSTESEDVKLLASKTTTPREYTVNPLPCDQEWTIEPTPGPIFSWKHSWKLPRCGRGSISFAAQGNTNVQVAISAKCQSTDDMYQIRFGGWENTMTSIGKRYQGPVAFAVAATLTYPDAINCLWISIDDRTSTIQLGRGEPGQDVFAVYNDNRFFLDVQYVSFTSHITPVTFSNVVVSDVEYVSPLDPYNLSRWIHPQDGDWHVVPLHGHYNWARFWTLPSPGRGIVSFAIEGIDVHIAISAKPHTTKPMYEILLGGWENSQTIVRKHKQKRPALWTDESLVEFPSCQYWVLVDEQTCVIQIGRGVEPCQGMFCIFKDPEFLLGARYITFTSSKIPILYSNVTIIDIVD